MRTFLRDLRHGARLLFNKPGFTAAAVTALALGIGATTAMFSLVNAFLLKPVHMRNPERIVGCYSRDAKWSYRPFSYPNYADLRASNTVFTSVMAHNLTMVGLSEGDSTRRTFADLVSSNYFETLGTPLFRGRPFTAEEERPGSQIPVVIVSYSYWKRHGADPALPGRQLRINGRLFTVAGIAPEGFTGTTALIGSELYLPLGMYEALNNGFDGPGRPLGMRDNHTLIVVGRLKPGITQTSADAQLFATSARMEHAFPSENKDQILVVRPLARLSVSTNPENDQILRTPAVLLFSMATVVLLIASLNVANMMLARGADRRKEIAVRLAIGASRRNILQQLFAESLILALLGGAGGLAIASWGVKLLVNSMSRLVPLEMVFSATPDLRVLAATAGFCLFSTLLFGLGPGWKLSRPDLVSGLKDGAASTAGGHLHVFSRRNLLAIGQLSLSLGLLTCAGLFVRSALQAAHIEPGFRMDNLLLAEVDAGLAGYDEARGRQLYPALVEHLKSLPGVQSAAIGALVPFGLVNLGRSIQKADSALGSKEVGCRFNLVDGDYFGTLGIPFLRGRTFRAGEPAAIIDQGAAERLWPKGDAVGHRVRVIAGESKREVEIVGVVGNIQEGIIGRENVEPHVYIPFGQEYLSDITIHVRTAPGLLPATVRAAIREVDPRLPLIELRSFRQHLESGFDLWTVRTGAQLFTIFGAVALLLAAVGLYGVRAYNVARRTRELGIRMALGAGAPDNLRLVLREGLAVTGVGLGLGLGISLVLGKVLASLLYRVSGIDLVVFLAAPAVLTAASLAACYLPARRTSKLDPLVALRYE
jgi:predicted permease